MGGISYLNNHFKIDPGALAQRQTSATGHNKCDDIDSNGYPKRVEEEEDGHYNDGAIDVGAWEPSVVVVEKENAVVKPLAKPIKDKLFHTDRNAEQASKNGENDAAEEKFKFFQGTGYGGGGGGRGGGGGGGRGGRHIGTVKVSVK